MLSWLIGFGIKLFIVRISRTIHSMFQPICKLEGSGMVVPAPVRAAVRDQTKGIPRNSNNSFAAT